MLGVCVLYQLNFFLGETSPLLDVVVLTFFIFTARCNLSVKYMRTCLNN